MRPAETPSEPLFFLTVEDFTGRQLVAITGRRASVIEAALSAILDGAADWRQASTWPRPHFKMTVQEFKGR